MRLAPLAIAAALAAALASAALADACASVGKPLLRSMTAKSAGAAACLSQRARDRAHALAEAQSAQYGMGYAPGATKCVNGWVALCRCFSYGCQWMATAYRCGG